MARDAELVQPLPNIDLNHLSLEVPNGAELFTHNSQLQLLFDPSKIPPLLAETIGDDLHARPLASDDFLRSHFGLLSTLSAAPALAPTVYNSLFNAMRSCNDTYFVVVVVEKDTDMIVASGSVVKERKFIHGGGYAGHIEDIVVSPKMQGRGLGIKLVSALREMATAMGCYKTILDCQEAKIRESRYVIPLTGRVLREVWFHPSWSSNGILCSNHCTTAKRVTRTSQPSRATGLDLEPASATL